MSSWKPGNSVTINTLRRNLDDRPSVKAAKAEAERKLIALAEAGRLDVRDISEISTAAALEGLIREKASGDDPLVVCVDALFNLSVWDDAAGPSGIREENIERANILKRLSSDFHIPVWTTAELRKRGYNDKPRDVAGDPPTIDAIMETSKYSYNANAVFMLYPEAIDAFFLEDSAADRRRTEEQAFGFQKTPCPEVHQGGGPHGRYGAVSRACDGEGERQGAEERARAGP